VSLSAPASAEILITQQKALAGNVSPGDLPGFPITLSRAGVYSLAGNLAAPAGKDGIVITDGDVSLDLNGFFMHGTGGVAKNGITGSVRNVTIRNGTLIDFGENGINGQGPILDRPRYAGHRLKRFRSHCAAIPVMSKAASSYSAPRRGLGLLCRWT
jgi:hypothetical protein